MKKTLEQETLSALVWLVADGILDFKLAMPRNRLDQGEFHDKFGIFSDSEGNKVSFNGSYNDNVQRPPNSILISKQHRRHYPVPLGNKSSHHLLGL